MTTLTGVAAGLAAAAGWAGASHLFARALERSRRDPNARPISAPAANLFKNLLALAALASVAFLMGAEYPSGPRVGWLLLSGLAGFALGDAIYFAAFARCGVQPAAILGNLVPPLAALLAWWFLDDALPAWALAGMSLSVAGIVLVIVDRGGSGPTKGGSERWVGIGFAIANSVLQAIAITTGRVGLEDADLLPGTVLRLIGGVLGALLIAALTGARRGPRSMGGELSALLGPLSRSGTWRLLTVATLIGAVLNLPLHSLAMGGLSPGVSSILFATTPLWTLPIGLRLGERYGWRTALGTLAAFGGVALVVMATR
ncbi:MAG: EamA family transporter [Planctomycetota bacterium]